MNAASGPRDDPRTTRLLSIDLDDGSLHDGTIGDLRDRLRAGDLLVVNDAATLPASLAGTTHAGEAIEVRLAGRLSDARWQAILFGAGDWRTPTEHRPPPPVLGHGDRIVCGDLVATITDVDAQCARLVTIELDARHDALWPSLYRAGRPVQYAYARDAYALWDVQTAYAARPWAVEPPSAGFALTWDLLLDLRRNGTRWARVTHAAGLSSTGDPALDARLPLAEWSEVPAATVAAIESARVANHRIVAVGTTVVRALEGAAAAGGGRLRPWSGLTGHRLGRQVRPEIVDAVLTGVHEAGSSHFALLEVFAPRSLLDRAQALAVARGYQSHEFGDAMAIWTARRMRAAA